MANITALLNALSNLPPMTGGAPLTPLPGTIQPPTGFGPSSITPLDQPPGAPAPPLDLSIISKYLELAGAPPVQPTIQPAGKLDKIAAALSGFSAGINGQGPQYAASLREERQRPQREFEARQQQYEQQKRQLGLRGLEEARGAQEKGQARQTFEADRNFQLESRRLERELDLKSDNEKMMLNDLLLSKRQREDDERQYARQQAAELAQQKRDARLIAARLGSGPGAAPPEIAEELGQVYANLKDSLSPAAAKWKNAQARRAEMLANRPVGGSGGSGGGAPRGTSVAAQKAFALFEGIQQQVAGAVQRGDAAGEQALRRRLTAAFNSLSRFPGQFELGYGADGITPYAKPKQGAAQPTASPLPGEIGGPEGPPVSTAQRMGIQPAQGTNFNLNQPQAAPAGGMSRAGAKAKLIANGYSPARAEAELNRLGIR